MRSVLAPVDCWLIVAADEGLDLADEEQEQELDEGFDGGQPPPVVVDNKTINPEAGKRLQGVVLVDSFTQKFRPVTLQKPKVLLPLGGFRHMLDLNLEWLSSSGVAELILLSCAHTEMIRKYVDGRDEYSGSPFSCPKRKFSKVTVIECTDCLSAGDALRQLDQQNIIRSDFLLVHGDVVSNMRLEKVLTAHRQRRQKDKQCIATLVVRPVGKSTFSEHGVSTAFCVLLVILAC